MIKHFFIAGAQRCGTTLLYHLLEQHPRILMARPLRPEPKHFLSEVSAKTGIDGYRERFFATWTQGEMEGDLALGEKSTSYIESKVAAHRIHALLPQAKFIFLLRDPIERAVSNVVFSRDHGFETEPLAKSLLRELDASDEVLDDTQSKTSVSPQAYLSRSCYLPYLNHYAEIVGRRSMLVMQTEALIANQNSIREIYEFLGTDPNFVPIWPSDKVNASRRTMTDTVTELDAAVVARLKMYFGSSLPELSRRYGVDLGLWATARR